MSSIMVVDDEKSVLKALGRILKSDGLDIEIYDDPEAALKRAAVANFDVVLSDYRMPVMDGVALLKEIKVLQPDAVRIILSGYADLHSVLAAINEAEIYRFISKPWHDYELKATVGQAISYREMLVENRYLANQVREQASILRRQNAELYRLEKENPGITKVHWAEDGSIILDD